MPENRDNPKKTPAARRRSLARHIFVRVAVPVAIVFLGCISTFDRMLRDQLKLHLREELRTREAQLQEANQRASQRSRTSLGELAATVGLRAEMVQIQNSVKPAEIAKARQRLEVRLAALTRLIDEDVYAIADASRETLFTLIRKDKTLQPASRAAPAPDKTSLLGIDGQYYFLSSFPLESGGVTAGWIVLGRNWLSGLPSGDGAYLIAHDGVILGVSAKAPIAGLEPGSRVPECPDPAAGCEVDIHGERHLMVRAAAKELPAEAEIYLVRSLDALAGPLLFLSRSVMTGGVILSLLGALALAMLMSRTVAGPLRQITQSCAEASETGLLPEIRVNSSRIDEIFLLTQTLAGASRSIQEGQTKLTQAYFQFMGAIVAMLDARDPYTAGHSHRVSAYSEALARDLGLPTDQVDDIRVGALLHDIGKIGVPDEVLHKHERLTREEFDLMKQHPTIGRNILERIGQFDKYLDAVELHHESLDGSGYPRGLRGEQIPISARIVKVADVYDALSTDRPYRKGLPQEVVFDMLRQGSGKHFDRLMVEVFLTRCVPHFQRPHNDLGALHKAVHTSGGHAAKPATV